MAVVERWPLREVAVVRGDRCERWPLGEVRMYVFVSVLVVGDNEN